jgi:hypothetical protein
MCIFKRSLVALMLASFSCLSSTPFVMGHLMGQLGNQFFIIAATTSLALENGATPIFPHLVSSEEYNIPINYERVFKHLNATEPENEISTVYRETTFTYSPIPYTEDMMIFGYFQSEKYFLNHKTEIIELFSPHPEILEYLNSKYNDILSHPQTVAIHYRSYKKEDPRGQVYSIMKPEYYKQAMARFPEGTLFVVFSNDIKWCRKNLSRFSNNMCFIEGESHIDDLYLMSRCHHQIICNSSFSWWAAYLNPNENKSVIVPQAWFSPSYNHDTKDLIPDEWEVIPDVG